MKTLLERRIILKTESKNCRVPNYQYELNNGTGKKRAAAKKWEIGDSGKQNRSFFYKKRPNESCVSSLFSYVFQLQE